MAKTDFAPSETTRTDVQIGLVVADQRTGDLGQVIYADSRIVLTRDETGSTTMTPRRAFETELGTRYRARPGADPDVDGGQYERLRDRLAEYDRGEGRKVRHKADALREALDLLGGAADEPDGVGDADGDEGDATADADDAEGPDDREVAYEEIPGIGPETAANLRSRGFVTVEDVRGASDDVLRSVAGVGPDALGKIRNFVE